MTTTNSVRVRPADVFPLVQSSTRERLMSRVNNETLCEIVFMTVTISMATFLSYVCYHALQNYRVL